MAFNGDNPLCEICKEIENYEHLFIDCPAVDELWQILNQIFKKCKFSNSMKQLQYLVLGYKPNQVKYVDLNFILSLIGYGIFKYYCLSGNRRKYLDPVYVVKYEFICASQICKLLNICRSKLFQDFTDYFVHEIE